MSSKPAAPTDAPSVPSGPAVPPPAPQPAIVPPANPGGSSDARNSVALPVRNKKEPRTFATPSAASVNSAPSLLLGVSNLPFYTNQKLETNTFVPSAIVLFAILAELDSNMASTYRYLQSAPTWIPLISQAYISVLFYIQIFRVAREANVITQEQFQLLQWFESAFDSRTMMIPGPLVPVFQSLATVSGPFEWIGNISAALTDAQRPVRAYSYSPVDRLNFLLPNVPLIVDQIQWFLESFTITSGNEHFIPDNFFSNVFGVNANIDAFGYAAMKTPSTMFLAQTSTAQYRAFKSQATTFRFPPRLGSSESTGYLPWFEALRFKSHRSDTLSYSWFSTISSTMQRYCQFVHGSVPLSAISLTGLGACTPTFSYQPVTELHSPVVIKPAVSHKDKDSNNVVQSPQRYFVTRPTTLSAIGSHVDIELEELAEQYSAASQVNVSFIDFDQNPILPTDNNLRRGEVWDLPDIRSSPIIDVLPTHGPIIMSHYHSDTRNTSN